MPPLILNPTTFPNWNEFLLRLPHSTFFHTSSWATVLQESYGYMPVYVTLWQAGTMQALIPCMEIDSALTGKRGVSLPFTDRCEPLVSNADGFQEMFRRAASLGKEQGWKYLELRGSEPFLPNEPSFEHYYGHTLDLTAGKDNLFANLRDSTRRNIKKAEKENLDITISASPESLKAFRRLNAMTRRDHGLPPQPSRFFQAVYDHILSQNLGFIVLALFNKTAVAGNVYFHFGDEVIYKYGASDRDYQHLRANNLIMWKAVQWACDKGYRRLCFGRTERDNEGLRQFKSGWGAEEHVIKYYRYDLTTDAFVKESNTMNPLVKKIFSRLPLPVSQILGDILYRHAG